MPEKRQGVPDAGRDQHFAKPKMEILVHSTAGSTTDGLGRIARKSSPLTIVLRCDGGRRGKGVCIPRLSICLKKQHKIQLARLLP